MPQSTLLNPQRLVLLALLVAFTGCGRIAFVSERYDNFTAYYNTFYNAEKSYSEGIDALEQADESIDRQVYISIFEAPGQSTNNQQFQAAIDKSADVLREHPESKWVDDALVLIGKSYFYQQNYVGAEQKFREVIGMSSPLEDEARLWLARTLISAGAHDEAREHLLVSLNREDLSRRWEPSLRLALGELHVKRSDYDAAIEQLTTGLDEVRDNRYRARASFLLGQIYETVDRYEDAVDAYQSVLNAHPRYQLSYAAQYSAVRVQGLYVDADEALRMLRRMERDDKNYTNRFELAYLRGRIYQSQNYAGDARALYHDILYDSDGQISDLRGRVHYALAELYRDAYQDYQTASAHFDTSRTSLRAPAPAAGGSRAAQIQYAPEAIIDAEEKASMFGSFAQVRAQLAEMDSLLYLGSLDDEAFSARILEIRRQLAAEMAEEERRAARLQAERGFQEAAAAGGAARDDGSSNAASTASGGAGFLFHQDPVRVQEGRMNFINRWGDRPLAPNWRRIDAIRSVASLADSVGLLRDERLTDLDPSVGENPLPPIDYSNVPRDSLSVAAMRARRAAARYELANVLFLAMNEPDSAATWYRKVIEEDHEFSVAQRAFYALAEVHSSLGDSTAARRLYEQVLEQYPSSDFAGRVRERLGIRTEVASDTLAIAEEEYDEAFDRWRRGSYQRAVNSMVELAASYPQLEVAPRALLAAGHIFVEWAERDSMNIFDPIPLSVSESTLERAGLLGLAAAAPDSAEHGSLRDPSVGQTPNGEPPAGQTPTGEPSAGQTSLGDPNDDRASEAELVDEALLEDKSYTEQARPSDVATGQTPPGESASVDTLSRSNMENPQPGKPDLDAENDAPASSQDMPDVLTPTEARSDESSDGAALARTDSLARADSLARTDSLATAASAGERAFRAIEDSTIDAAAAESLPGLIAAAPREEDIYLKTLYAGVKQNYPSTAYAERAERLLGALREREAEQKAVADSLEALATAAADSAAGVASDDWMMVDSLETGADSLAAGNETASAGKAPDSTVVDTTTAVQESAEAPFADGAAGDTTAVADTTAATETTAAAETTAATDTTAAIETTAAADTIAEAGTVTAADTATVAGISDTPQAGGDSDIDSDTTGRVDPTSDRTEAARDTDTSAAASTEKAQLVREQTARTSEIPTSDDAIRGDGGINSELGGYTLLIGSDTKEATMRVLADKYAAQGFRADVIVERGPAETIYRAAVGHFASQRDARILMRKYGSQIKETVQLTLISDIQ